MEEKKFKIGDIVINKATLVEHIRGCTFDKIKFCKIREISETEDGFSYTVTRDGFSWC